jgi:hypothetical protein
MKFELKQKAKLIDSGECGVIIGHARYTNAEDSYLLRYKAADGKQTERWWAEDALEEDR